MEKVERVGKLPRFEVFDSKTENETKDYLRTQIKKLFPGDLWTLVNLDFEATVNETYAEWCKNPGPTAGVIVVLKGRENGRSNQN